MDVCVPAQDLLQKVQKHSEVEMVDLVLKLKDKLVGADSLSNKSWFFWELFFIICVIICISSFKVHFILLPSSVTHMMHVACSDQLSKVM